MKNYKLTLCYDGTRYNGWQKQGNTKNTIQEKLEVLLTKLLGRETEVAGSGRTDAGVHAYAQVCSFRAESEISCDELLSQIRRYLPEDIGAISLETVPDRFHARLSARSKTYIYRIWAGTEPNVFERKYLYFVDVLPDIDKMRQAAQALTGEHDFSSFCANSHMKKSAVRVLESIEITRLGNEIRFSLTGSGFLYNMVRIIVGTLLEVGWGKRPVESVKAALEAKSRVMAGFTAPPQGLSLYEIKY